MKKGFTLIELLVVVAIIGLLATVVLASLNSARAKSRDARRVSDLGQIKTALFMYALDNGGSFPGTTTASWYSSRFPVGLGCGPSYDWSILSAFLSPTYIPVLPLDPNDIKASSCTPNTFWYFYARGFYASAIGGASGEEGICFNKTILMAITTEQDSVKRDDCGFTGSLKTKYSDKNAIIILLN